MGPEVAARTLVADHSLAVGHRADEEVDSLSDSFVVVEVLGCDGLDLAEVDLRWIFVSLAWEVIQPLDIRWRTAKSRKQTPRNMTRAAMHFDLHGGWWL
jgi:hypothetical protein